MKYTRLYCALFLLALLSALLLYSAYAEVRLKTIDQLDNQQVILAEEAARGLEGFFDHYARLLDALSRVDSIVALDEQGKKLMEIFYQSHAGEIVSLARVDAGGRIVYALPLSPNVIGADLSGKAGIRELMETHEPVVSDVFTSATGLKSIAFHVPVFSNRAFEGSLTVLIPFTHLAKRYLEAVRLAEDGYAWMISRQGVELYCPVPGHVGRSVYENCKDFPSILSMADEMVQGKKGRTTYFFNRVRGETLEPVKKHAVYLPVHLPHNYWSIVVATPESEVLGIMHGFRNKCLLLGGIILLAGFLCSYYLARVLMIVKEEVRRKRMETALQNSKDFLDKIINSISDPIFVKDIHHRFVLVNDAQCVFAKRGREEIIGRTDHDYCSKEQADVFWEQDEAVLETGLESVSEEKVTDGLGNTCTLVTKKALYEDKSGNRFIVGITRDITMFKRSEEHFRQSEERYRLIFNNAPLGIMHFDRMGVIQDLNDKFADIMGAPREKILGFNMLERLRDPALLQAVKDAIENGTGYYEGNYLSVLGGKTTTLRAIYKRINAEDGGAVGIFEDITKRKRAEKGLKDSEQQLRSIIQGYPIPAFVIGTDHQVVYWNKALEEMSHIPANEVVGTKGHWRAFYSSERPCMADLLVDEATSGTISVWYSGISDKSRSLEEAYEATDFFPEVGGEEKWLHFTAAVIRDSGGKLVGAIETLEDVTARQKAEDALISANRQLNDIIEFLPDATLVVDRDKKVIAWNRAIEEMTGVSKNEMIGKGDHAYTVPFYGDRRPHLLDLVDARDEKLESNYPYVLRKGDTLYAETYIPRLHGGEGAYVFAATAPLLDAHGNRVGGIESIRDITEQKQAAEALRESRQQLSDIINFLPDATFVIDGNGKVIAWNHAMEEMTGITAPDILGKENYEYSLPFYGERRPILIDLVLAPELEIERQYVAMQRTGSAISGEAYMPALGGGGVYLYGMASALFDSRGNVVGAIESIRDISDRKHMEEAVAEAETKYRSIFENSITGIYQSTIEGRFLSINNAFARILGYDSPEEVLDTVSDISRQVYVNPERRSELLRLIEGQGMAQEFEVQIRRKDKSDAWITLNIRAVRDKSGESIHLEGTAQDITDRKLLESQLNQAQKMEAIGTLAGGIAHDFNNILAPIIGYSELSLNAIPGGNRLHHNIEQILLSATRARELVKQILTFSRKTEQERKPVQVSLLIRETLKLIRSTFPSTIEIRQDFDEDAIDSIVTADPTQIHQVLMNLCTNANHSMREKGGVLSITLKNVDIDEGARRDLPDLDPGPYLRLTVADTGHGIEESVRQRIFEPYFTTKGQSEGTGLGLALIYGIVKSLSGGIAVFSKPGEGATFSVYFPRVQTTPAPVAARPVSLPSGKGLVLVVDDERPIVDMLRAMLESLGYDVAERYSSYDALQAFRARPDSFDLVITDLTMPHMTGIELAREILKVRADTPILLCTGFSEAVDENRTRLPGIRGFLMKPVALRDLAVSVSKILSQGNTAI